MTLFIEAIHFFLSIIAVLTLAVLKYDIIPFYVFLTVCLFLIYKERKGTKEESKDGMFD